ncbi:hypothetical protein Amsp01_041950 [Amycolatopsis sp. NBRC 101858]|nr:hypothetical protein Amsp01_041950 [Amycolatopsis sp. NBRC 101858]
MRHFRAIGFDDVLMVPALSGRQSFPLKDHRNHRPGEEALDPGLGPVVGQPGDLGPCAGRDKPGIVGDPDGNGAPAMRARDIMTTPTFALTPSATLDEAAKVMTERGFTTMPVVDADGRLLGLLSEVDILRAPEPTGDPDTGVMLDSRPRTAGAVMRTSGLAVAADTAVHELARRMTDAGVRSAPVVEDGHVVGMVTFQDVLRAQHA